MGPGSGRAPIDAIAFVLKIDRKALEIEKE